MIIGKTPEKVYHCKVSTG